uniref:ARAD1C18282p n=1 Tax=Blastobotrys adeninivorans TaxID=409370 RepID=A0A060T1S1_BLAAD
MEKTRQVAVLKPQKKNPTVSLIAGGVAGGVEAAATYPFEYSKTRMQLEIGPQKSRNPFTLMHRIARQEGIAALYKGCPTLILGTTLKASVRFASFDSIKNQLADSNGALSPARGIFAGMVAGAFESVLAVTPTERIKTALIDDAKGPKRINGFFGAVKLIYQDQGARGLLRGLVPTTAKQSATSAVRMGTYNGLIELQQHYGIAKSTVTTFFSGAIAGIVTVYATQPFDTIKTVSQTARASSTVASVQLLIANQGIRGLWNGSTMRLGRLIFSGGIVFSVYEKVSSLLSFQL